MIVVSAVINPLIYKKMHEFSSWSVRFTIDVFLFYFLLLFFSFWLFELETNRYNAIQVAYTYFCVKRDLISNLLSCADYKAPTAWLVTFITDCSKAMVIK